MADVATSTYHLLNPSPLHINPATAAFRRSQQLGWLEFFHNAAAETSCAPELLMAIAYRESSLLPKYLKVVGDSGHGYGLMQIDDRSYPEWVKSGAWRDAASCISKGAEVLSERQKTIERAIGRKGISLKDHAGQICTFDGQPLAGVDLSRVLVASYNCGLWAYCHFSNGRDIDCGTTGKDYSRDVMCNAAHFKELLNLASNQK